MIDKCESCGSDFLTEADPHVVRPTPKGYKLYCYCHIKGFDEVVGKIGNLQSQLSSTQKKLEVAREALSDLVHAQERMFVQLKKHKRDLIYIHNTDDPEVTKDNIRANVMVIASNIGYEMTGVNFWNITPAINKAKDALEEIDKLEEK